MPRPQPAEPRLLLPARCVRAPAAAMGVAGPGRCGRDPCGALCLLLTYLSVAYADYVILTHILLQPGFRGR